MSSLVKQIQNTAFQNNLWQKRSRIVMGVSGGPDSVCLLDVMAKLAPRYNFELVIAHVNYGLRGADSERDEKFVRSLAEKYKIKIYILDLKNPKAKLSEIPKLSFRKQPTENVMRDIRYEFFERIRIENNFDLIAVAHNADDQVETFLMRLIRGSGLKGLSAMQYKSKKIIRPLLGTSRAEILKYLKNKKLNYRTDKTNETDLFFRNKIRNNLIPYLEKNFNSSIKKTILAGVVSIAEDHALIQELSNKAVAGQLEISARKILKLHPALQRRVLLRLISEKNPGGKDIEAAHVSEMLKAIKSTKNKNQIVSFKGLKMERKGDKVTIVKL